MKNLTGENLESAAAVQQVDTNSYQQEAEEFPEQKGLLDQPSAPAQEAVKPEPAPEFNPQAEHFRSLRDEVDRLKTEREAEKREHQLQLDMFRANQSRQEPPRQEPKFLDGMREEDIPNVGELRREWEQKERGYQERLEELQVAQQHPDYAEVLEKFVVPLIRQKPHLAEGIHGSKNKALFAYELGKMAQQMQASAYPPVPQESLATTKTETAQRIVENAKKPGTLSQAGGQGALSKADYYAQMSDQEFIKFASKNLDAI